MTISFLNQNNFTVSIPFDLKPAGVEMVSPDYQETKQPAYTYQNGGITINIDGLYSYDVIKIKG